MSDATNIVWHHATVTRARREQMNGHKSVILWFTGLSGAGKSTLAHAVEEALHRANCRTFVFDGDNVRHGLCSDLGFAEKDRVENIRRVGEMPSSACVSLCGKLRRVLPASLTPTSTLLWIRLSWMTRSLGPKR